jgi:hypothetical protein
MKINLFFNLFLLLSACTISVRTEKIDFSILFHNGKSNLWFLVESENNLTINQVAGKICVVFYESGDFVFGTLDDINNNTVQKGKFELDSEEQKLSLFFNDKTWKFKFFPSNYDIQLEGLPDSDFSFNGKLTPFPELN